MADFKIKAVIALIDKATGPIRKIAAGIKTRLGPSFALAGRGGKAFARVLFGVTKKLALIGGGLAVTAGAALSKLAFDFVEAGDELGTFAAKTGLTVEAIQELRSAAERTDVDVGVFNSGIESFTKNIGMAKAGTGKLTAFLKKVSPELLKQVKGAQGTGEAFEIMVQALHQIEDPAKRAALATAAFGGAGKEFVLFAEGGVEALRKLGAEKRKDGVLSTEEARRAGEVDDAMKRLNSRMTSLKLTIGAALLPVLEKIIPKFSEWLSNSRVRIADRDRKSVV